MQVMLLLKKISGIAILAMGIGTMPVLANELSPVASNQTQAMPARLHANPSIIKINVTQQSYNARMPWKKLPPVSSSGVGVVLDNKKVLVTASLVQDARYIEFEKPNNGARVAAKVMMVDFEANLALLQPSSSHASFMDDLVPLQLTPTIQEGDGLEVWQLGRTGELLVSPMVVNKVVVGRYLLPSSGFLTLEANGILRAEVTSVTLPFVKNGQLAGLLLRYDTRNQSATLIPSVVIAHFLRDAADGVYAGFPSVGLLVHPTLDPQFRDYLGLKHSQGGVYVGSVMRGTSGDSLGIVAGDTLLSINGRAVDRRGEVKDPLYGTIHYSHLLRGEAFVGETVRVEVLRNGHVVSLAGPLVRKDWGAHIVPMISFDAGPNYIIHGGLVFQELTYSYLQSFGDDWSATAPPRLVQIATDPSDLERQGIGRIVLLAGVLPVRGTQGYEDLAALRVTAVNGMPINNLFDLQTALQKASNRLHKIEFDDAPKVIYLDENQAQIDNKVLLEGDYRIGQLSRLH